VSEGKRGKHTVKYRIRLIRALPLALALIVLASCGNVGSSSDASAPSGSGPAITVGSKNFTEQYILGNMYALALENAGFNVERKLNLGSEQIADKALQSGQIDLYPEYTGTALVAILPYDKNPAQLNSPRGTYQQAKKLYAKRDPADTMLKPAPFNNTYGIFVRSKVAEQKNLTTLADLAKASPDLTFVSFSEFQNRSDGYPNMQKNYSSLDFGNISIVNSLGLRYQGVLQGDGDVGVGFTTDGQLASNELKVMKDTKSIWPFYYPAPVVRSDVLKKNPKMKRVLDSVSEKLDVKTMRKLNGQVDLEQEDPEDVARQFLKKQGILK
jgi:osmoprotectant transport system substrate-binding protein